MVEYPKFDFKKVIDFEYEGTMIDIEYASVPEGFIQTLIDITRDKENYLDGTYRNRSGYQTFDYDSYSCDKSHTMRLWRSDYNQFLSINISSIDGYLIQLWENLMWPGAGNTTHEQLREAVNTACIITDDFDELHQYNFTGDSAVIFITDKGAFRSSYNFAQGSMTMGLMALYEIPIKRVKHWYGEQFEELYSKTVEALKNLRCDSIENKESSFDEAMRLLSGDK